MISRLQFITQETDQYNHLQAIEAACNAGVQWVQLRVKDKSENEVLALAIEAKKITDRFNTKLIINDKPEVARKVNAYGLHLGKEDMKIDEARKIVGNTMIIGGTANTLEDIINYSFTSVNYIGLGPYRFTSTKKKLSPVLGLDGYKKILEECDQRNIKIPIIAIGGIEEKVLAQLMKTGVYGVAISSSIIKSSDIKNTIQYIKSFLDEQFVNHSG